MRENMTRKKFALNDPGLFPVEAFFNMIPLDMFLTVFSGLSIGIGCGFDEIICDFPHDGDPDFTFVGIRFTFCSDEVIIQEDDFLRYCVAALNCYSTNDPNTQEKIDNLKQKFANKNNASFEDLTDTYNEHYKCSNREKYLLNVGLVKLLKENGYFDVAYIFRSGDSIGMIGHKKSQLQEHDLLIIDVLDFKKRCDISLKKKLDDKTLAKVSTTTIEIDDLRLFQYKFLLLLSQYIKQTEEYRKNDASEYLHKDFPVKVDAAKLHLFTE
jgi:hypothetical protein